MDFEDKVCPEPKQAISDEQMLGLWRSLPSEYKQFDELVLRFGRLVQSAAPIAGVHGWIGVDSQPIPTNLRVLVQNASEIAMAWLDVIDSRLYFAPQGGLVPFAPTHWMHLPDDRPDANSAGYLSREAIASIAGATMESGRYHLFMARVDSAIFMALADSAVSTITPCVKTDIALQSDSDKASETAPYAFEAAMRSRAAQACHEMFCEAVKLPDTDGEPHATRLGAMWAASRCESAVQSLPLVALEFESQDAPLTDSLLLEALEIGLGCAQEVAANTHQALAGYEPRKHAAVDADVEKISDAIRALLAQAQVKTEPVAWVAQRYANGELVHETLSRKEMPECVRQTLASQYEVRIFPLFAAPVSAPQPKTDSVHQGNSLAGDAVAPQPNGFVPGFGLSHDQLAQLLGSSLKPEEIASNAATRHDRVRELLHWFARFTQGNANPKWAVSHACELAYYIATNDKHGHIDLEAIKKASFLEGVNISASDRDILQRLGLTGQDLCAPSDKEPT